MSLKLKFDFIGKVFGSFTEDTSEKPKKKVCFYKSDPQKGPLSNKKIEGKKSPNYYKENKKRWIMLFFLVVTQSSEGGTVSGTTGVGVFKQLNNFR